MISSLSYDNIIMIPKRRFIKEIEIRILYKSVFGWGSGGGWGHFINLLTPLYSMYTDAIASIHMATSILSASQESNFI